MKASTSAEILKLDEQLKEAQQEHSRLLDAKVGVAMVIMMCCHGDNDGGSGGITHECTRHVMYRM